MEVLKTIAVVMFVILFFFTHVIVYREVFIKPFWKIIVKCWGLLIITFFMPVIFSPPSECINGNDSIQGWGLVVSMGWFIALEVAIFMMAVKLAVRKIRCRFSKKDET